MHSAEWPHQAMDFVRPTHLYLLILVPLAVLMKVWAARRRQAGIARLGSPALIAALSTSVSRTRRGWQTVLWIVAMVSVIVALARPRWGTRVEITTQRGVQVMVVLDVSASMLAEDIRPNRLARAKLTVEELMDRLGGNELGLVLFAGAAFVQFPLTADFTTAHSFLNAAGPWSISRPGTALEQAIRVALKGFPEEISSNRVILLLTDGEGHEGDPLAAATAAAEAGTVIHAIGFGSDQGEPIPVRDENGALVDYKKDTQGNTVLSRLNETTLQQMVNETGGLFFRASAGGNEVSAITDAIATLDTGESAGQFETRGVERFQWFTGLALLALAAELLVGDRVKRFAHHASHTALLLICTALFAGACAPEVARRNNIGNERFAEGAYDEAIAEYRQAQVDDPDRAEPYYNAANTYNRQAKLEATLAQMQQALKTADPDLAANAWYNLGNTFSDNEKWTEAIAAYQEALRIRSSDQDAKHNLELALQRQNEQQQGEGQEEQEEQEQQSPQDQDNEQAADNREAGTDGAAKTPQGQSGASDDQDATGQEPVEQVQEPDSMTAEQAQQLLQALVGDSETLQERLQEVFGVPSPPPERDW